MTKKNAPLRFLESLVSDIKNETKGLPDFSGKIIPYEKDGGEFYIPQIDKTRKRDSLPVPPDQFKDNYGRKDDGTFVDELYLKTGNKVVKKMKEVLKDDGFVFNPGQHILEFGCSAGRLVRCLAEYADSSGIWGVDINARHITWAQQNLSPPFNFVTTTTAPHLPFEDRYFDLIFAGSVFTHIAELADAWLLELRRILKINGRLYITILDHVAIETLKDQFPQRKPWITLKEFFERQNISTHDDYGMLAFNRQSLTSNRIAYNREYLTDKLQRWFKIKSITNSVYAWQSGYLLEKLEN